MWKARYAAWVEGTNWQARRNLGNSLLLRQDASRSTLAVPKAQFSTIANPRNSFGVLVKVVPSRSSRVLMTFMSHHKRHHLGLWLATIRARRYGNSSANATLLALCASGRTGRVAIADREKRSLERRRLSQLALVRDAIRTRPTCRRPLIPVTRSPKPYVHSTMLRVQQPPHSTKMMRMLIFRGIDISQPGTLSRLLIPR